VSLQLQRYDFSNKPSKEAYMNTKNSIDVIEQNIEREMVAAAALEIQTILIRHFQILSIFASGAIEEIYELDPCSEFLRTWQRKFLDFSTSGASL